MAVEACCLRLLLVLVVFLCAAESKYIQYNTTSRIVPGKLNVHLVPHTHDDVGWVKTVDQYYTGSNNSLLAAPACVRNVLDSLVPALLADKNRKFIYAEQAFFQLWWREQSEVIQDTVKQLVTSGQLEFINGGMSMHDEAATHYIDMIDQTTLGHRFIKQEFNVTPRVGWQIDTFGHSAVQAYLLGAEVGFDSLFFGRIDYQDRAKRKNEKSLEVVWRGSKSFGSSAQAARQLEFFKGMSKSGPNTEFLADALAIVQHHDAISGTSRQHVADDYIKRLSKGYKEAEKVVAESLSCLTSSRPNTGCKSVITKFQQCPLLNISYCPPSEVDLSKRKELVIVVYNPLGWKREDVIKIPVVSENVTVKDFTGKEIESQILPLLNASVGLRNDHVKAYLGISPSVTPRYWLAFSATVPPLGFSTYIVSSATQTATTSERRTVYKTETSQNDTIKVGPGNLKLIYSGNDGKLIQYTNSRSAVKESVKQSFSYYRGDDGSVVDYGEDGNPHSQASGAYIFRPNGTYPIKSEGQVSFTVLRGPLLDEVHQRISSWIYQVTRIYREKEHAEIEFTIGPIPVDDGIGKEIVTKISTSMKTNKQFYTDSNGRDFIQRIRDYRKDWDLEVNQPVAGNYYPINLGIYMKDNNTELSLLVDRSVGGSSIVDGQLELMLHRRLLADDDKGVTEALDEEVCIEDDCKGLTIIGKYHLRIDPLGEGARWRRSFGQEIYSPFLLAFTEQDGDNWTSSHVTTFSGMDPSYVLPDNVAILTLQELEDGKVLFRLAHLYQIEEDKDLSVMASVELKKVFAHKKIKQMTEMSLSANQGRLEMETKRLIWNVEGSSSSSEEEEPKALRGGPVDPTKLVVDLAPMEIRTFTIHF